MSDMLAAFLYAQLENVDQINNRRNDIWDKYLKSLIPLANEGKLRLPYLPPGCQSNSHLFYFILKDEGTRDALMRHLKNLHINSVFHYVPLHLSPVGQSMGYEEGDLPVTESLSGRLLRLPFYYEMTRDQQQSIVNAIFRFFQDR